MIASFTLGLGSCLFAFAQTLFNAILMQHLAPHQQAKFQTPVQTLAAVGQSIGPYLGTLLINIGDHWVLGGAPLMLIMAFISIAVVSSCRRRMGMRSMTRRRQRRCYENTRYFIRRVWGYTREVVVGAPYALVPTTTAYNDVGHDMSLMQRL